MVLSCSFYHKRSSPRGRRSEIAKIRFAQSRQIKPVILKYNRGKEKRKF
jgi:hypothetical protein